MTTFATGANGAVLSSTSTSSSTACVAAASTPVASPVAGDATAALPAPGLFRSVDDYRVFRAEWKALAHAKALTAAHMAAYALLTGRSLEAAFSPITNPVKLANGQVARGALQSALACLRYAKTLPAGLEQTSAAYQALLAEAATTASKAPAHSA